MNIRTLLGFLIGRRDAILAIASTPSAIWLGLLFVLSAGFAREYDGEDLLREPWHLLIPLGASLLSCTALFLLLLIGSLIVGVERQRWFHNYRCFLTLFWMTAPLAWLYAIPFERLVSAGDAMKLNLALLGLVALWRVVLMVRVVSVMFGASLLDAFFFVLLFADSVALVAIELIPKPIVSMMGGIRHTESERILLETTCCISFLGSCFLPIWIIGAVSIAAGRRMSKTGNRWSPRFADQPAAGRVSAPSWALGVIACAAWLAVLPATQAEQQLRSQVEQAFADGEVEKALRIMSAHLDSDFPPHYDPPPRIGYGQSEPSLLDVLKLAFDEGAAPWVVDLYTRKFTFHAGRWRGHFELQGMDDEQLERYVEMLHRIPEGREIADRHHSSEVYVALHLEDERAPELSERRRQLYLRLEELLPPREEVPPENPTDSLPKAQQQETPGDDEEEKGRSLDAGAKEANDNPNREAK